MATAEWEMKWLAVEPLQGEYKYTLADEVYDFAVQNGMKVRGHTLIWHHEIPDWAYVLNEDELRQVLKNMITYVNTSLFHYNF